VLFYSFADKGEKGRIYPFLIINDGRNGSGMLLITSSTWRENAWTSLWMGMKEGGKSAVLTRDVRRGKRGERFYRSRRGGEAREGGRSRSFSLIGEEKTSSLDEEGKLEGLAVWFEWKSASPLRRPRKKKRGKAKVRGGRR